eukprot:gnl/Dysnectes_brevis/468_a521_6744.p1 GENE.gnl/Dysnectes_brevis/468_a521_6744~~gnl/Dysnectes_brevis/468_a521_6744.p1  ORF type:complete len:151 (+),score=18.44 gnl/Dysnectes_brevis/468_a521_6744:90-542(+)
MDHTDDQLSSSRVSKESLRTPIYKDKYITLHQDKLVINKYYFPFGKKTIAIASAQIFNGTDVLTFLQLKTWGMSMSPIWWSCGSRSRTTNFVAVNPLCTRCGCGFSVEDPDRFMSAVRELGAQVGPLRDIDQISRLLENNKLRKQSHKSE